jgi:hypothetical protein
MICKNVEEFIEKRKEIQNKIDNEELRYDGASVEYQMANEVEHQEKMKQLRHDYENVHHFCKSKWY